jgi:streptogramin lyase
VLYCEADECYYTRYLTGQIVKINPKTWEAEVIYKSNSGIVWGMAFHPVRKTELWLAYNNGEGAELANSLCRLDVSNPGTSFEKMGGTPSTGFRDGPLAQAQFYGIRMISFDSEGGLFVGDGGNSCIRRVDTQTMMVETIIGIPGVAGFKNGKKEDALFFAPHGLVVDSEGVIYVSEYENLRVRRIAIE